MLHSKYWHQPTYVGELKKCITPPPPMMLQQRWVLSVDHCNRVKAFVAPAHKFGIHDGDVTVIHRWRLPQLCCMHLSCICCFLDDAVVRCCHLHMKLHRLLAVNSSSNSLLFDLAKKWKTSSFLPLTVYLCWLFSLDLFLTWALFHKFLLQIRVFCSSFRGGGKNFKLSIH